jgi:hypothetical protein
MYPKHRKKILAQIKERMSDKSKSCVLISTSLVEAGVDLDFNSVYRQVAGVDSVIQAAGRCNREGIEKKENSKVYIFDINGMKTVPGQSLQSSITKGLLQDYHDISNLECITEYFKRLYHFRENDLDKKNIIGEFKDWKYNFETVSEKFHLIEENTRIVFIPIEQEAKDLLFEIKNQGYGKARMRKASQYCVQIYNQLFDTLYGAGIIKEITSDIENFYEFIEICRCKNNLKDYADLNKRYLSLTGIFEFNADSVSLIKTMTILLQAFSVLKLNKFFYEEIRIEENTFDFLFKNQKIITLLSEYGLKNTTEQLKFYKYNQDKIKLERIIQEKFSKENLIEDILPLFKDRQDNKIKSYKSDARGNYWR